MTTYPSGKTALVLAGGGLTGTVYEMGALRAINDVLVGHTVNDFDIFVGTSAGALVSTLLANGFSPEEMVQTIAGTHPEIPPIARSEIMHYNYNDLLQLARRLPKTLLGAWTHYLRNQADMSLFDVILSLSEALPAGVYDNLALEKYLRGVIKSHGTSNRFGDLAKELHIIATDLDTGKREVFNRYTHPNVPISKAVAASTALPLLYKPVTINDRQFIDGGIRGNASLDVAIEQGATLIVCINPLVPFNNSDKKSIPFLGADGGFLGDKGLPAIATQVGRITTHAGLHYHIKQLRKTHPEVSIILIEPSAHDREMAFYNIMRFSARMIVARHGFETVTLNLAENYAQMKEMMERHGIRISRRLVLEELEEIRNADYDPGVIRRVLEARSQAYRRRHTSHKSQPVGQLKSTLNDLDRLLNAMSKKTQEEDELDGVQAF